MGKHRIQKNHNPMWDDIDFLNYLCDEYNRMRGEGKEVSYIYDAFMYQFEKYKPDYYNKLIRHAFKTTGKTMIRVTKRWVKDVDSERADIRKRKYEKGCYTRTKDGDISREKGLYCDLQDDYETQPYKNVYKRYATIHTMV